MISVLLVLLVLLLCLLLVAVSLIPFDHVDVRWRTIKAMTKLPGPFGIPIIGLGVFIAILRDSGNN